MFKEKKIPEGWQILDFMDCIKKAPSTNKLKIQKKDYNDSGKYPIIDQGVDFIAGFTNNLEKVYDGILPIIIFGDHTRIFKYIDFPFALGADGTKVLIPKEEVLNPKYFYYFLKGLTIEDHGYNRHYKFLKEKKIVVPLIETQKKIVEILEKAEKLKEWRAEADELADAFLKGIFFEMFGNPVQNPKNWKKAKIKSFIKNITAGWSAKGEDRLKNENELGVLKISAVTWGEFLPDEHKAVDKNAIKKSLIHPMKGDVLFSRANTRELVAAACMVTEDRPDLFLPDKLWKIETDKKIVNPYYLLYVLKNESFRNELRKKSTGTSGSMLNISQKKFVDTDFPIPPIKLQNQFAEIVKQVETLKTHQKESKQQIDNLFNALMQKAFKGELTC